MYTDLTSNSSQPQILASDYFCNSTLVTTRASQDTWTSTNTWNNDIAAQYHNESAPAHSVSSSISLESPKTNGERRKIVAGRVRATTVLEEFDISFNSTSKAPKPSKKSETRNSKPKKSEEQIR